MRFRIKYLFSYACLLLPLLLLFSCRSNFIIPELPKPIALKISDSLHLTDISVKDILVKDSLIIISNYDTSLSHNAFHFFSPMDLAKISEAGELGDMPGRLRFPVFTNFDVENGSLFFKEKHVPDFYTLDFRNLISYNSVSSDNSDSSGVSGSSDRKAFVTAIPDFSRKYNIPEAERYPEITKISENHFLLHGIADEPITVYNNKTGKKRNLPFIEYFSNLDYINNIMLNRSAVAATKSGDLFFVALDMLDRVVLFNSRGYVIRQNLFSASLPMTSGKFTHHFGDIYSCGEFCYVHRFEETNNPQDSRLLIFDLSGRLTKTYSSPVGFGEIAVSEDGTVYTVIRSNSGYSLYKLRE